MSDSVNPCFKADSRILYCKSMNQMYPVLITKNEAVAGRWFSLVVWTLWVWNWWERKKVTVTLFLSSLNPTP
jgi:hypothetical protein